MESFLYVFMVITGTTFATILVIDFIAFKLSRLATNFKDSHIQDTLNHLTQKAESLNGRLKKLEENVEEVADTEDGYRDEIADWQARVEETFNKFQLQIEDKTKQAFERVDAQLRGIGIGQTQLRTDFENFKKQCASMASRSIGVKATCTESAKPDEVTGNA
jgi:predicted  nucleic acid-binding Zn-ribbon protein